MNLLAEIDQHIQEIGGTKQFTVTPIHPETLQALGLLQTKKELWEYNQHRYNMNHFIRKLYGGHPY